MGASLANLKSAGICGSWTGVLTEGSHVLQLKVLHTPVAASDGAEISGMKIGDTIDLLDLTTGPETEVLSWRYSEQKRNARPTGAKRQAMSKDDDLELPPWPDQRCFSVHHRFWRVSLQNKPECFCILQMATNPDERTPESLEEDTAASVSTATYAHKFNKQQSAEHLHDPPPAIKVAAPLGCQIVDSGFSSMFTVGECVMLYVLPCVRTVDKYIFNCADPYLDLPQAFFHFVTLSSGGRELAYDLQGIEDDKGDIFLVDPAILKVNGKNVKEEALPVCGIMSGGAGRIEWDHFQSLHPKCSPLCKVFDPHRAVRLGRGYTCCN